MVKARMEVVLYWCNNPNTLELPHPLD